MHPPRGPAEEYHARLQARRDTHARSVRLDARLSVLRLAIFAAGAALAIAAWRGSLSPLVLLIPAAAFAALIRRHDRVIAERDVAARAAGFYERAIARLEDRWIGSGDPGERFRDPAHLYADDLDIFGRGSLFELLSLARTRAGEDTLASWLKVHAPVSVLRARHDAVTDLAMRLDLREELSLAGAEVGASVDPGALSTWAARPPLLRSPWPRVIATLLTAAAIVTGGMWAVTGDPVPFFAVAGAEVLLSLPLRRRLDQILHGADSPARDLDVLAHVLTRLERDTFTAPRLVELQARLISGVRASEAIRQLHRLVEFHDWQHNQFFAPVAAVLLWGTHLAYAIEAWRRRHGVHVSAWLETVGELEALNSLSAYRYEHPDDPFPEFVDGPATLDGAGLGHPLLPAARMVRNDLRFEGDTRLLIVSGSNMSGKSTFLRTAGVNVVLALAGAPVRARRLRLTPLTVGATLRIQDSLQEGRSRFYAEVTRVRAIADLAGSAPPLLFLFDELFHGTNSHDRLVGASGVLRNLLDRGAIGLVTTHDLALTAMAGELGARAINVHFEDDFSAGELRFDYRVKPGAVTRSNALALMRAVGLDVRAEP